MSQGAQVINFSIGTTYDSSALKRKLEEAQSQGIHIVAAAGNTNGGPLLFPAAYNSVISVAATDSNDNFASFSSIGAELAAPGVAVTSTVPGGGYATWSGTSMAAPHVSASVALMIANQQTNIRERLHQTALDLGAAGKDSYFGYGRIVAKPAVLGEDVLAPVITFIEPAHLSEVASLVSVVVEIQDEFEVTAATLSANSTVIASWESSPYSFIWDASAFMGQDVTLVASAVDDSNNLGAAQIAVRVVSEVEPSPSPSVALTPTAKATRTPVSPKAGQNTNVRQDKVPPGQEAKQDTNQAQQELPPVTNYDQRNPQPTSAEQSTSDQSGSSQSQEARENPGQENAKSERRGKAEVRGITTQACGWPLGFICRLLGW
jgi:hypothetical protein